MIGAADWHLLLLFVCLFGVTAAFAKTGLAQEGLKELAAFGLLPERLSVMGAPDAGGVQHDRQCAHHHPDSQAASALSPGTLTGLALLSTFAGNLLLTGSLCNIIVAERAASAGARLSFLDFARSGSS